MLIDIYKQCNRFDTTHSVADRLTDANRR